VQHESAIVPKSHIGAAPARKAGREDGAGSSRVKGPAQSLSEDHLWLPHHTIVSICNYGQIAFAVVSEIKA
jgi:hypothetical protein